MLGRQLLRRIKMLGENRRALGRRGERLAARYLRRKGFRIVARNVVIGRDEADLLALDPDSVTLVVVEVKTRASDFLPPEVQINRGKQEHMTRLAASLLKQKRFARYVIRFDVIAIDWPEGESPEIRHIVGAFESRM